MLILLLVKHECLSILEMQYIPTSHVSKGRLPDLSLVIDTNVIQNKQVIQGHYRMALDAPAIAEQAKPGQFLHVSCGSTHDPLLRRPISIHALDRNTGMVSILYRVAGKGTALLAERKAGDIINIIGPLGNGFTMPKCDRKVFVVSGGIGIVPLYFLLQELAGFGIKATVFQGASTSELILLEDEIKKLGHTVIIATDDGTKGFHGSVTELFENYLREGRVGQGTSRAYACGAFGMQRNLSEITARWGIPCEVALEERMGCGVGACLSCACKVKNEDGGSTYRRVCREGPVFPSGKVIWE